MIRTLFTTVDTEGDRLTLMAYNEAWAIVVQPKSQPAASVHIDENQLLEMHASIVQALHPAGRRSVSAPPEDTQRVRRPLCGPSVSPPRWVSRLSRHFGG